LLAKLQVLTHPHLPIVEPNHTLFAAIVSVINSITGGGAFTYTVIAVIMQITQAIYLNNVAIRHKLYQKPTYLVAFLYILLTSINPYMGYFSVMLLLCWLLIGAIDILLGLHQTVKPRKDVFNAGFILSCAALLHFPAVYYIIFLFFAIMILRSFNIGEWIVAILGYLTPLYFAAGILFLIDRFNLISIWPSLSFWFPKKIEMPIYTYGSIGGLFVIFLCGAFILQGQMAKTSVFTRRKWSLLFIYIIISILVSFSASLEIKSTWMAMMPALSLIITNALYVEKNKRFSNFIFYFSLLFLIFCQVAIDL
jgi:hypothetical protein